MVDKQNMNKKRGFTLVEMLVAMIIMMIVGTTMIQVLTRPKPRIETITLRGQYGCYIKNGIMYQQYMDERTSRDGEVSVSECVLKLDQRPARFYIVAAGAGKEGAQGQVVTKYSPAITEELVINLGTMANNGITTVMSKSSVDSYEVEAKPGVTLPSGNGLIPENIKSCKLMSAGINCPNANAASQKQQSCDVVDVSFDESNILTATTVAATKTPMIRINGCETYDEDGNATRDNLISIENLSKVPQYKNTQNQDTYNYSNVRMNLEFNDSSYITDTTAGVSKMSKILDGIASRRKSVLTKTISDLKPGAVGNPGAVLILW